MPHRKPEVLLLDVMDTLVHDPFAQVLPAYFGTDLGTLGRHKDPAAWPAFERGELGEADYLSRAFAAWPDRDPGGLKEAMRAAYRWLDGMEALLCELCRRGVEMHALSNYPVWYEMIEERLELSRYLPWTFVSCRTGRRKPDPRAYLGAAAALHLPPEACLFIDDRQQNCAAAEAVGMPAVRFTDAAALEEELRGRGVL